MSKMYKICAAVFALGILTILDVAGQVDELYYDLQEEMAPVVTIANLSGDSNVSSVISSNEIHLLRYQLYSGAGSTMFHLDNSTGILSAISRINRESICRLQFICVVRLNVGILQTRSSYFHTLSVYINILDINDNSPSFPQVSTELSIVESAPTGTSYIISSANDLDTGVNNSVQSYSLVPESPVFGIKTQKRLDGGMEVSLVIVASLDREIFSQYELTVTAFDGGNPRKSGNMTVTINITDINDNLPQFTNTLYNISVNETAPINVSVVVITATDSDHGENGHVTYRFSARQTDYDEVGFFSISRDSGDIYPVKSLTPLQGQIVRIVVEAKDGGADSKIQQCIVEIFILDNANNPPTIRLNLISENNTVQISEAASVGSLVAHFVTHDDDFDQNGHVSCFVTNSSDFSVRQIKLNQYTVILSHALDRETQDIHHICLVCEDGGDPQLRTMVNLSVVLFDTNDNAPIFKQDIFYINITENNESGLKLATVHATDMDIGDNGHVLYQLGHMPTITPTIQINKTTGDVIVIGSFNYEAEQHANISIIALDKGSPSLFSTATLYLSIMDENDNLPYFDDPVYIFNIKENLAPDIFLGTIHGRDDDSGNNGRLNYMLEQNSSLPFIISKDGDLSTTKSLDRENNASYTFRVIAFDMGKIPKSSDVQVVVYVLDENDHIPEITYPHSQNEIIPVSYHTVPGTELLQVEAEDLDEGDNSRKLFEVISLEKPGYFIIDQNSGSIFLNKQLTVNDIGNISLIVKVSDKGLEPLSSSFMFTIKIVDENLTSLVILQHSEQNMLVVIGLVSVTLVVAIIVLTIVIILKRTDRQKQLLHVSRYHLKDINKSVNKKATEVHDSSSGELCKTTVELKETQFHATQPTNEDLIVFKMNLAAKYQVEGGDASFSKETEISDVMSSVSGETTGCDSGRGASEGEGQDDGATSAPSSPKKHFMTFKGPVQPPTYHRIDQIKTADYAQIVQNHFRNSVNLTDSYKIKSSGSRHSSRKDKKLSDKFKTNTENNCEKFIPQNENYDNQKQYLKNVSDNDQYLDCVNGYYDNQYRQQTDKSFYEQSDLIIHRRLNVGISNQPHGHVSKQRHDEVSSQRNADLSRNSDLTNFSNQELSNHRYTGVLASFRNSTINNQNKGMDIDEYSLDTLDDGHSTTTSGSYTVDTDHYAGEFYSDSRYITNLNHNPQDVFV